MIRKLRLVSECITSQTGKQIVRIHLLPNTSRSKDNQIIKFGQLIEYNTRNIFLENAYTNCGGELVSDLFLKIKIEHISGSTV